MLTTSDLLCQAFFIRPTCSKKANRACAGKGSGKKSKKPAKVVNAPEGEDVDRVGKRYFPGPATLPEAWREKPAGELVMSGSIEPNPGRATMGFKQGPNGIPIFRR